MRDFYFLQLQENLQNLRSALAAQMAQMQLGTLCSHCASTSGGGCCSSEMAGETDAVQILINLLAGIEVRTLQSDGSACCFLGAEGCIFAFKPMFCLNYNCSHIHSRNTKEQVVELEGAAGKLLSAQYHLENYLVEVITREGLLLLK